ncbi:ABC transporter ATP-binding protein [Lactococcus garvieae]|uniref:ABC transporter ATP-binding protein n=1 Tax=Lactococcus garvieae TaxID=1363 RepID=UPI001F61C0C3|nr:ABC transporter ATP-binding protein [Lactococcus garvieae]MCI3861384.1 ABC transporter ATP-binding protein [Lactococcus garvieae]
MITLKNISKSFGGKKVLCDVSMKIVPGKITSLIGLNGAGKSTLISLIMEYKKYDLGTIEKDLVSVMPDTQSMIENMTGLEFLRFICQIKTQRKNYQSQINELSRLLFIANDLTKKIKDYSFGMRKKLSFIQAYIGDFDSYIFDEPTSGVDIQSAQVMMDLLVDLKKQGKAILLTNHNLEEVQQFSDYIYILKEGHIINEGPVDDIVQNNNQSIYSLHIDFNGTQKILENYFDSIKYEENGEEILVFSEDIYKINKIIAKIIDDGGTIKEMKKKQTKLREVVLADLK